jgi:hypothetical protein
VIYRWRRNPVSAPSRLVEDQARADRLIVLIQLLLRTRPHVLPEIERLVQGVVTNDVRQQIAERLQRLSVDDVRAVEALTAHFDQRQLMADGDGDPPEPDEDG